MVRFRSFTGAIVRTVMFVGVVVHCSLSTQAGEIRLKNGTVLNGSLWRLRTLSDPPSRIDEKLAPRDADPNPKNIVLVDDGLRKCYAPRAQIPAAGINNDVDATRSAPFVFDLIKGNQGQVIASAGSVVEVIPFDKFGHRTVSLTTQQGKLNVRQAISRIESDYVVLDALNYNWQTRIPLRDVPSEVLDKLLRQHVDPQDPASCFALVRFYSKAKMYPQALGELQAMAGKFPDQQQRIIRVRSELMDYFGREVLRELNRRRAAGQHQLARKSAVQLTTQELGGAVTSDVWTFLRDDDDRGMAIGRAKNLLAELQVKLKEPGIIPLLQPLRSEINDELDVETLSRLDAFLQSETDNRLTAEQRLALAYSGWVVGAANAVTDLNLAIRYWDTRHLILDAARAESIQDRDRHYQEMQRVEGVGPKIVMQLAALLPPFLDPGDIKPERPQRVSVTPEGHTPSISYSVLLPPEYSPHHSYPLLIALRSQEYSTDQTLLWWGGDSVEPGASMRRGYIVIAPEYAEEGQAAYGYGEASHKAIIESLRDARKRFNVDSNRVFLAGHAMGADAAFDVGMSHPDEFAGVVPIGGNCRHYPSICYENGHYTSWYVIGRSPVAQRDPKSDTVLEKMLQNGTRFDFMLVEYPGRGVDRYQDEVPKLFDWMDLHVRKPPPSDFEIATLRTTDDRHFWVSARNFPKTIVVPPLPGTSGAAKPVEISAKINGGNQIIIKSPAGHYQIRLSPDAVDFEQRVEVRRGDRQLFYGFVKPEVTAILDELRTTGDRARLPLGTLEL